VLSVERIEKSEAEWKKLLTQKQYEITAKKGTEAPGTCPFDNVHEPGIFRCVRCGTDLFRSSTKFESGTGWPSFYEPVSPLMWWSSLTEVWEWCGQNCSAPGVAPTSAMFLMMALHRLANAIV